MEKKRFVCFFKKSRRSYDLIVDTVNCENFFVESEKRGNRIGNIIRVNKLSRQNIFFGKFGTKKCDKFENINRY